MVRPSPWGRRLARWLIHQVLGLMIMVTVVLIIGEPKPSVILDFPYVDPGSLVYYAPKIGPRLLFLGLLLSLRGALATSYN